ncbi:uncharacterized protein LOC122330659 [Puntigrus tetrazona]|uniref:uncharacterized protein LOC122330659 n=1 Tax=Puntigrus tetrazona TaxID=1606681 RepID=UPI001C89E70A|nr:uncharacterized protein LOC122330659 [Puntigrus tetrazona]
MRLSLVSQPLVFISVLLLTSQTLLAQTISPLSTLPTVTSETPTPTTALAGITTTATAKSLTDPCYKYSVVDDAWSPGNQYPNSTQYMCNNFVNFVGWYRLFINGQSARISDKCDFSQSCSFYSTLWLNGAHPNVGDGVVTLDVCAAMSNSCCYYQPTPIHVKACPGGYYVYEILTPSSCSQPNCAVRSVNNFTVTPESALAAPDIFYPFSSAAEDRNPAADDGSSSVILLSSPFPFFGRAYQRIYVNNNGHLTFDQPSSAYAPYSFPTNGSQDIIAGLWTDLDNRAKGVVSYHQYTSGNVLTNATRDINTYFPNQKFNASWVFVATWNKVAYFSITNTSTSFQVVLISGSNYSFILMNYGEIAVTEHPVEAGYGTINSTNYFVIPGSNGGGSISNLRYSSNVNVPGRWAFRVDSDPKNSILKNNVVGVRMKLSSFSDLAYLSDNIEVLLQQELVKNGLPNAVELKLRKLQKTNP